MRRGGRARRAMLGAVATGALLGAAQGFNLGWKSLLASATAQSDGEAGGYTGRAVSVSSWGNRLAVGEAKADESKSQVSAEMSPVHRRRLAERLLSQEGTAYPTINFDPDEGTENPFDGNYKVVTASGLEIEIDSTSATGVYTIAPIGPIPGGDVPTIKVAGEPDDDLSACIGGVALDLLSSSGKAICVTVASTPAVNTTYTNLIDATSNKVKVSECGDGGGNLSVSPNAPEITCDVNAPVSETYTATHTNAENFDGEKSVSDCLDTIATTDTQGEITCDVNAPVSETYTATHTNAENFDGEKSVSDCLDTIATTDTQ